MKKSIKATVVTLALGFTTIYAESTHDHSPEEHSSHKGHDHSQKEDNPESHGHSHRYDDLKNEVSKETIEKVAKQKVQSLVAEKKIHKSWKSVPISKIGKTHYGDTDDWVVGYKPVFTCGDHGARTNMRLKNEEILVSIPFRMVSGLVKNLDRTIFAQE